MRFNKFCASPWYIAGKAQKRKWKEDALIKQLEKKQKALEKDQKLQQEKSLKPSERG